MIAILAGVDIYMGLSYAMAFDPLMRRIESSRVVLGYGSYEN